MLTSEEKVRIEQEEKIRYESSKQEILNDIFSTAVIFVTIAFLLKCLSWIVSFCVCGLHALVKKHEENKKSERIIPELVEEPANGLFRGTEHLR